LSGIPPFICGYIFENFILAKGFFLGFISIKTIKKVRQIWGYDLKFSDDLQLRPLGSTSPQSRTTKPSARYSPMSGIPSAIDYK
jgi:hypothetical protein